MKRLALVLLCVGCAHAAPASTAPILAPLRDTSRIDGCGCELATADQRWLFWSDGNGAWVNLDGVDTQMTPRGSFPPRANTIGSSFAEDYDAGATHVNITYTVTRACQPDDEACESNDYDAQITVTHNKRTEHVAARGACGC